MTTYFIAFMVFVIMIVAMSVGVIFRGRTIKGSCGGLNQQGACKICGNTEGGKNSKDDRTS